MEHPDTDPVAVEAVVMEPCPNPWCRSHKPERYHVRGVEARKSLDGFVAECGDCDLTGPWFYTEAEAIAAWNRRTPQTPIHNGLSDEQNLREAARKVLSFRQGEQPTQGWLRDTDACRTALTELAAALRGSSGNG